MKSKDQIIVIGSHNKEGGYVPVEPVGKCLICKKTVYLATMGMDGELEIVELRKLKIGKFIGMECAFDIVAAFKRIVETSIPEREKIIKKLLKEEKKNAAN